MSSILIVEDEQLLADSIAKSLKRHGYNTHMVATGEDGLKAFRDSQPDLVILDYRLPGRDGLSILRELKEIDRETAVIMVTAYGTVETAVEAMKIGAYDYIEKPIDLIKLHSMIGKLFENQKLRQEVVYHRGRAFELKEPQGIIGKSPAILKIIERMETLVKYDTPRDGGPTVLLCGETGTGKEVFARAIHRMGPRAENPFIEINCTAIPENMIEAELFGYHKGAFTDAKLTKAGLMEAAEGGTLFLDEVGHLGLGIQAKLLKLVEEKVVRRLGELQDRHIDVKIIAATNRDLDAARAQGAFREDLYHRLNVIRIDLPPLRERGHDMLLLADYFLDRYTKKYSRTIRGFTGNAHEAMMAYHWPGNVRELQNVIERAVLLENVEELSIEHLAIGGRGIQLNVPAEVDRRGVQLNAPTQNGQPVGAIHESPIRTDEFVLPEEGISLMDVERMLIEQALERCRWNRSRAAKLLGISLDTLRYRIEKYGLRPR